MTYYPPDSAGWHSVITSAYGTAHLGQYDDDTESSSQQPYSTVHTQAKEIPISEYDESVNIPFSAGSYPWSPEEIEDGGSIHNVPTMLDTHYLQHQNPALSSSHYSSPPEPFSRATSIGHDRFPDNDSSGSISPIMSALPRPPDRWSPLIESRKSHITELSPYMNFTPLPSQSRRDSDNHSILSHASSRDFSTLDDQSEYGDIPISGRNSYNPSEVTFDNFIGSDDRPLEGSHQEPLAREQADRAFYGTLPDADYGWTPLEGPTAGSSHWRKPSWAPSNASKMSLKSFASSFKDRTSRYRQRFHDWKTGLGDGSTRDDEAAGGRITPPSSGTGRGQFGWEQLRAPAKEMTRRGTSVRAHRQ